MAGVVLAALLMILSPVTAASHPLSTLKAPFSKSSVLVNSDTNLGGCGNINVTHAPTWSATTGNGSFAVKQTAKTCTGYFGSQHVTSIDTTFVAIEVALAVHLKPSNYLVQTTWKFKATGSEKIASTGTCASVSYYTISGNGSEECGVLAETTMIWWVYLLDTTNGTIIGEDSGYLGANYSWAYLDNYCYYYTCYSSSSTNGGSGGAFTASSTNTTYISGTFVGTHAYQIISVVEAQTYAYAGYSEYPTFQPGGTFTGSASASINMATGGEQATLSSVKVL